MPKLHVAQLSEVMPYMPEIEHLNLLRLKSASCGQVFMCGLGFEGRCLNGPTALATTGIKSVRAIYFEYGTNRDDNTSNRSQLLEQLGEISGSVESLEVEDHGFPNRLRQSLKSAAAASKAHELRVLFDISVVSNRLLMRTMKVLMELDIDLTLLYSEAALYHPTLAEYQSDPTKWESGGPLALDFGVNQVEYGEEHPGYQVDQLPDCVISICGFSKDRTRAAISKVDPSLLTVPGDKVVCLVGVPHLPENHWRLAMMRKIHELGAEVPQYEVSTFDYKKTLCTLEEIYEARAGRFKFTLSPLGSKMQALGSALFCYLKPDIRVVFATPKQYNATLYSEGCRETWSIEFGSIRKIRELLDTVGLLRIEE